MTKKIIEDGQFGSKEAKAEETSNDLGMHAATTTDAPAWIKEIFLLLIFS